MTSPPPGPIARVRHRARVGARPGGGGLALFVLALVLLPVSAPTFAEAPMQPLQERAPVPGAFVDDGGAPVRLESLRGRLVLLNFWATWCAPCVEELPAMDRLAAELADAPFTLLAANVGDPSETIDAFLDRVGLDPSFTVVRDADGRAARDWGLFAYPTTFLIDASGRATHVRLGATDWDAPDTVEWLRARLPSTDGPVGAAPSRPTPDDGATRAPADPVVRLATPARPGSREPDLALGPDGVPRMSWLEPAGTGVALRTARLAGGRWSEPVTVAAGDDWFLSWADFPSLAAFGETGLAVWWPVRSGPDPYAYDARVALSRDGGATWDEPVVPHRDGTPTQHGMVSLLGWPDGRLLAVWLDGRENAAGEGTSPLPTDAMALRGAVLDERGRLGETWLLDPRVCTCCATAAARVGEDVLVAYRDRSEEEVRDFSLIRHEDGAWGAPRPLHRDGWTIAGCPINGAALAADGPAVAASWFTAAGDRPRVLLARSRDGGRTFDAPVVVDEDRAGSRPLGRIDVVLLEDGSAVASWIAATGRGEELRYRRIAPDGVAGAARTLALSARGRTIGFPRAVRDGDAVVFAWSQPSDDARGAAGLRSAAVAFAAGSGAEPDADGEGRDTVRDRGPSRDAP